MNKTVESQFVKVGDINIHYLSAGVGEPILFIHGFPTSSYLWSKIIEHTSTHYRVIAIDLPAHGQTQWPHSRFTPTDVIQLIELILDRENTMRFELIGHSFGSYDD